MRKTKDNSNISFATLYNFAMRLLQQISRSSKLLFVNQIWIPKRGRRKRSIAHWIVLYYILINFKNEISDGPPIEALCKTHQYWPPSIGIHSAVPVAMVFIAIVRYRVYPPSSRPDKHAKKQNPRLEVLLPCHSFRVLLSLRFPFLQPCVRHISISSNKE